MGGLHKRQMKPLSIERNACIIGGNVNWHSIMENNMEVLKKKIELTSYDLAILLLSTYLKETKSLCRRDICVPMFITYNSQIAKIWEQPKFPPIDE